MKSPLSHLIIWVVICSAALAGQRLWYAVIAQKSTEAVNLQSQIDAKVESAARIASARTALVGIAGDESAVRKYFVPESEVVSFINNLESRGRALETVVKVLSVSTDNLKNQPTLTLVLSINGTFDAVMRTVGVIEHSPYNLSISNLSLGKEEKNLWTANLKILVGSVSTNPI